MSQAYVLPDALTALEACKTKLAEVIRSDKPIPANVPGFLSHLRSFEGYDEPEILPSSTR